MSITDEQLRLSIAREKIKVWYDSWLNDEDRLMPMMIDFMNDLDLILENECNVIYEYCRNQLNMDCHKFVVCGIDGVQEKYFLTIWR
jgi:hypothetical protein